MTIENEKRKNQWSFKNNSPKEMVRQEKSTKEWKAKGNMLIVKKRPDNWIKYRIERLGRYRKWIRIKSYEQIKDWKKKDLPNNP